MPETANTPQEKVRQLQRKLYVCAKQSRTRRFHALYDRIYRSDVLWEAWRRGRSNGGAAGIDAETIQAIEQRGGGKFLAEDGSGAACRSLSSFTGEAAIHTESRREAAAVGDTYGTGSSGADGDEAGDRADLRGGLSAVQLWIPAEEERDPSPGSDPRSGQPGIELCRRCRHTGLLRQHSARGLDGAVEGAHLGPEGVEVDPPMVGSRSDGGWHGKRDSSGYPARRSNLAVAGQHLPKQIGSDLGGAVRPAWSSGPICRRFRSHVPDGVAGKGRAPA